jgi:hypothetical protein
MADNTGQLDKLIENKVDQKIRDFAKDISNQIKDFLKANGDYSGDYLYQAAGYKKSYDGTYNEPIDYNHRSVTDLYRNIKGGLDLTIKDRMITRETKDLLAKVALLS